jgi:hypothetical protein
LRPKTGWLQLGQLVRKKIIFFNVFFLYEWTTYFTSFPGTLSMSNSDFVWARGEVLFEMGIKFISHVFYEELLHAAMWVKLLKGKVQRKKFVLPIKSWFFTVFHFFFFAYGFAWCHLQCDPYDLNVKFLILFKKIFKVHRCWSFESRPRQQKEF